MPTNEGLLGKSLPPSLDAISTVEAIIDYIATTPQNINYNMLREILNAFYNGYDHPYF